MLPLTTNIKDAYANGLDEEQKFIQNLAMFLCAFLKDHGFLIEKPEYSEGLLKVSFLIKTKSFIVSRRVVSGPSLFAVDL